MPTKQELHDLCEKCDWKWTRVNGVEGYIVSGRGDYASNSIFLPCAGIGDGTSLSYVGSFGSYWSSVPDWYYNNCNSWCLYFISGYRRTFSYYRLSGQSVRPVQGATK